MAANASSRAGVATLPQFRQFDMNGARHPEPWSLNMDKIKPLFTATASAIGGRNGHTEADDGIVKADLSVPKAMGGPGKPGTATPEQLFAAGYRARLGG